MTDNEVIIQILGGERDLFRHFVERYQPMVFRTCMGFLHNKEDADDLTQEVFMSAYQSLGKFKGDSSFSTWMYRIAVNASLNKVRKSSKHFFFQQLESVFSSDKKRDIPISENENPEDILIRNEHREWVTKALNSLPESQRTAIVLSNYDDLPQKEIAEIMNTTEGAVEALLQRGKANLRKILSVVQKKSEKQP